MSLWFITLHIWNQSSSIHVLIKCKNQYWRQQKIYKCSLANRQWLSCSQSKQNLIEMSTFSVLFGIIDRVMNALQFEFHFKRNSIWNNFYEVCSCVQLKNGWFFYKLYIIRKKKIPLKLTPTPAIFTQTWNIWHCVSGSA